MYLVRDRENQLGLELNARKNLFTGAQLIDNVARQPLSRLVVLVDSTQHPGVGCKVFHEGGGHFSKVSGAASSRHVLVLGSAEH